MELLEESIKRGIIYVPGTTMGSDKGYVRFTYARENEENIHQGIKRFAEALQKVSFIPRKG
jgi:GntR family transcriptional regulator of abcA and norABC